MRYLRDDERLDPNTNYLVMVRHGQSMGNEWGDAYKHDAMNFLTERGELQVKLTANKLKETGLRFSLMVSSELTRARHSLSLLAHGMGDWQREYRIDPRFNERVSEDFIHDSDQTVVPKGDHRNAVETGFHTLLLPSLAEGNTLVVSHYYTMQVMLRLMCKEHGLSKNSLWGGTDHIPNGIAFVWDPQIPARMIVLNDETRVPKY